MPLLCDKTSGTKEKEKSSEKASETSSEFVYDLYRLTTIETYNEKLRQEIYRDAEVEYTSEILYFPEGTPILFLF